MMRRILLIVSLVSASLLILAGLVYAQDSGPQSIDAPQAIMGTAFTYQGQLKSDGNPIDGSCDFQLYLYDSSGGTGQIGSMVNRSSIQVMNSYFTITNLDFGSTAFNGEARWLRIDVRCPTGAGNFTTLSPRQPLTPAPYALALPGLYTRQNATSPNLVGGYSGNIISATAAGSVIGGGGNGMDLNRIQSYYSVIGGGAGNLVRGYAATIGGGYYNEAAGDGAVIGGGGWYGTSSDGNRALASASTIGGGFGNTITTTASFGAIGAGSDNYLEGPYAWIGGGHANYADGEYASVGGGFNNGANGYYATVPGGLYNSASMSYTFAAGTRAKARHEGTFVWADASVIDNFLSSANNQFLIRSKGGVGINTTATYTNALTVNGQVIGGGTGVPTGSLEPFVARGSSAGISLDDRSDADARWVVYANSGLLRFWNGVERMSVSGAGVLTIGALGSAGGTTLCRNASNQIAACSSSIRYKNNISALDLGLETIARLRPVTFDWNGTGEHDLGFVAEEVAEVTPLLTTRNAEGQIEGVKYDRVSAVLVKALQEQQQQIAELQRQNVELQTRLANLDQTAPPAAFNVFNLLSVITGGGFIYLLIQLGRSKHSL